MSPDRTQILVLNYNGRALLQECLPSVLEAARRSPTPCGVVVVDNDSADDSRDWLARRHPDVRVIHLPNRGLASFNDALKEMDEPVVLLLNNDVKLAHDSVAPLLRVFAERDDAFFSAPQCWTFDGRLYEGMRTRVRTRFGLVQGMSRVPGHEAHVDRADLTAAAGPVLAVDRVRFLELGGYDPIYHPGRIEDLDLGFRAWMAGLRGYYVPESMAYHKGFATFAPELGESRCDGLAIRNTLIFAWKNLRGARLARHLGWLPIRLAGSMIRGRRTFARSFLEAASRWREVVKARRDLHAGRDGWVERQEAFFHRFEW
ncbi:glycosyltransferase family 2 protein [Planctomyces sp. SH-PL62]|uniref:glycosyltransferase family 2 protein n=1 Tax=Planctomyces sp. SH-PL62 TaxID=1636152 RepID=UPI00078B422E|nr:glycosyltransferase family 2 protein [Planctomyces sp. SH-PL62]AMV39845.1 N-acetylglucosaminyl-diphospho-decaprenol L-rhamnosyltransferase [Planctomyces sp. SH-PL62]